MSPTSCFDSAGCSADKSVDHRITGNRQQGRSTGVGYDRVHVAIDDATRLPYVEVLADEQQAIDIRYMSRAVAWFNSQGVECRQVMSDNAGLPLTPLCQGVQGPGPQVHPYQALHASRHVRALYADPLQGMGLRNAVPELRGTQPVATPLSVDL
jgi:hypothetical protein